MVGLDPRLANLPESLTANVAPESAEQVAQAFERFCREVIDAVAGQVAIVKPQAAFFEQYGPPGMLALANTIAHARSRGLLVLLDGKRNDIGSTATAYAQAYLGDSSAWQADALTVSPYLGDDSLTPFVEQAHQVDAGVFVLVKTSNPGSGTFQDRSLDGAPLYQQVGQLVEQLACQRKGECGYGQIGAVVGATYPEQLAQLREQMPHSWFLVPGFGAQGGTAEDVAPAFDSRGIGAIVNSSRAIIFAYQREPYAQQMGQARWQDAVAAATRDTAEQLNQVRPAWPT